MTTYTLQQFIFQYGTVNQVSKLIDCLIQNHGVMLGTGLDSIDRRHKIYFETTFNDTDDRIHPMWLIFNDTKYKWSDKGELGGWVKVKSKISPVT